MGIFRRNGAAVEAGTKPESNDVEMANAPSNDPVTEPHHVMKDGVRVNHNGHRVTKGIQPDGESGRRGFHPFHFLKICFRSTSRMSCMVNVLWPTVPAAIAVRYARPDLTLATFILNYIAMVPCANLVGFSGQELARKLPKVMGVLLETTFGSVVEIVLFMVLLKNDQFKVIRDAILGSILATMLLCLGLCFFVGGMRRDEQTFSEAVSEVGNGLLLTAGLGLLVPTAFFVSLSGNVEFNLTNAQINDDVLHISRITSILLIVAYGIYVWFNMRTHNGIYDTLFKEEEERDADHVEDMKKDKLTLTESIIALVISLGLVCFIAVSLVEEIPNIVEQRNVSEAFMGLILVPLVEKFAEHLTAIDEAWDDTMNLALSHVLGATIQTSLFNAPLVVIVGWGLGKSMDLNFELFTIIVVILAIVVVGNFLRDQKSNYLEGALCVMVYLIIAVAAGYYPNPLRAGTSSEATAGATSTSAARF